MANETNRLTMFQTLLNITEMIGRFLDKAPNNPQLKELATNTMEVIGYIEHLEKENRSLKIILKQMKKYE
tara:strand:+ start:521 stop:730 length:210 start_codon:yes stop_codon:yes gene_type:complete